MMMNFRYVMIFILATLLTPMATVALPIPKEVRGVAGGGLHLYPLGWSSEGRWGTLIGREAHGSTTTGALYIIVIDAVTDEVLYESREYPWSGPNSIGEFWQSKSAAVMEIMNAFNLESGRRADVREAKFTTGGVKYTFALNPTSPADGACTLTISSNRGDSKTVYKSAVASPPSRTWLSGVLVSPFEERALAILRELPAFGGKLNYRFSGAHLTLGLISQYSTEKSYGAPRGSLLTAVYNGQEYLVKSRLATGADPNIRDNRGYPAILIAARLGHWPMVINLLSAGAVPNPRDNTGYTALHYAALANSVEAVHALLSADADKMLRDGTGQTPGELTTDMALYNLLR